MCAKDQSHKSRYRQRRRMKQVFLTTAKNAVVGRRGQRRTEGWVTAKLRRVIYAIMRIFDYHRQRRKNLRDCF